MINIPTVCDRFKKTVADPIDDPNVKAGQDPIVLLGIYREKLGLANRRILADKKCETEIREQFAKGHP